MILVFVIAFNALLSPKVSEAYENGSPIQFPSNYCTRQTDQADCETNWQTKTYVSALANLGIQLGGSPCTWNGKACGNTSSANTYKYTFTAPAM